MINNIYFCDICQAVFKDDTLCGICGRTMSNIGFVEYDKGDK